MGRRILIIDIETVAYDNAHECLEPFMEEMKTRNKKDLEKLAEEITEKKAKMIRKSALTPMASKVVAIGFGHVNLKDMDNPFDEDVTSCETELLLIENEDERGLLLRAKEVMDKYNEYVTFNGRGFDFPYLMFRGAINNVPFNLPIGKYNNKDGHFDLAIHIYNLSLIANIDSTVQYVSMKKWIRFFGISGEKKNVMDMDYLTNPQEFLDYLGEDIRFTWEMFKRFQNHFEGRFSR